MYTKYIDEIRHNSQIKNLFPDIKSFENKNVHTVLYCDNFDTFMPREQIVLKNKNSFLTTPQQMISVDILNKIMYLSSFFDDVAYQTRLVVNICQIDYISDDTICHLYIDDPKELANFMQNAAQKFTERFGTFVYTYITKLYKENKAQKLGEYLYSAVYPNPFYMCALCVNAVESSIIRNCIEQYFRTGEREVIRRMHTVLDMVYSNILLKEGWFTTKFISEQDDFDSNVYYLK